MECVKVVEIPMGAGGNKGLAVHLPLRGLRNRLSFRKAADEGTS